MAKEVDGKSGMADGRNPANASPPVSGSSDMPHYGNDAPFEVPGGWVWCRLKDITELIEDCPHSTAPDEGKGYPLIRTPNIGEGHLVLKGVHRVSQKVYENRTTRAIPKYGDIIYAREAPAGNAAVIAENETVCLGQRTVLIRPFCEYVNPMLLTYFMLSPYSKNSLIGKATGSTVQHVNMEMIRPLYVPIPPFNEQTRIVSEIERMVSLIDIIEHSKVGLQSAVNQAKSKILNLALSGKLTSDTSHYPQLPDGWECKSFSQVFQTIASQPHQIQQKEIHGAGKYPVVSQSAAYIEGYSDQKEKLYNESVPVIIFGDHTRNVKYVDFDFIVGADGVKILKSVINSTFAYYLTLYNSRKIESRGYSRHFQYLKQQAWNIPPEKEQRAIIRIIERYFRMADMIIAELSDN